MLIRHRETATFNRRCAAAPGRVLLVATLVLGAGACAQVNQGGGTGGTSVGPGAGGTGGTLVTGGTGNATGSMTGGACSGLKCQQVKCPDGKDTTISGTVFDPAGKNPLYNVIVYVPNRALSDIPEGVSCDQCAGTATGGPIASALSDANGHFVVKNAPVGDNIPLVLQVGKWRRQITIPTVAMCADTPITDADQTRLPRNQGEGHIPRIAVSTGHSDALECLLRKIGIADQEFTTDAGAGRVHMFVGGSGTATGDGAGANQFASTLNGGAAFPLSSTLWGDLDKLRRYDIVVLSCEGSQFASAKDPYLAYIKAYADMGGRLFTDHLHAYWMNHGAAPWPDTADYVGVGPDLPDPYTVKIDTSFAKGAALSDWLVGVGATTTPGEFSLSQGQYSVAATRPGVSQRWIYSDQHPSAGTPTVEYMTFNTPVEEIPSNQCGRVVFTDLHVVSAGGGVADVSHPETPFPTGCTAATMSPQEKALEFMFFDLSSCIQEDKSVPIPPIE